jgi:hypothetical protein
MLGLDSFRLSATIFPVVSPVISRPPLDVSPPPPPRPASALARPGWRQMLPRPKHPQLWGVGVGSFALGLINGALVVSAGIALVAYQQLLQLSPRQREGLVQRLQRGLPLPRSPQQQALVLALVTGASTYTFTSLWHSTHSLLMAGLLTGQGALALFALGALLRSSRAEERSNGQWGAAPIDQIEHNLAILSHSDPLKRLVAVRRLVKLAEHNADGYGAGVSVRSHLIDCFTIRLGQEGDAIVRSALEKGLTLLQPTQSLSPSSAAAFAIDSGANSTELSESALEPQFIPAPDLVGPLSSSESGHLEASTEQDSSYQTLGSSIEASTAEASTAELTRSSLPAPKERRAVVEYEEYLDI